MPTVRRASVRTALAVLALGLSPSRPLDAAAQQAAGGELPVSLERIRAAIEHPKAPALRVDVPFPVPRFEISVEARPFMLPFEEQLHKDLELTPLQRQSHEWASRCCGLDLDLIFKPIDRALQRRKERRIREQIARELAALKAADGT